MEAELRARLVETIAGWQTGLHASRGDLLARAIEGLVTGSDSAALAELAGIGERENPFVVDELLARVVAELELDVELAADPVRLAIRGRSRALVVGLLSPREFAAWAYANKLFECPDPVAARLADFQNDFDLADTGHGGHDQIEREVRLFAEEILRS